jgi:protein CpxP
LKDIKPLHDEMFSKRGDLRLLWLEKSPDAAKIAAKRKEINSLRDQMEEKRDAHRLQVYNILTPEQRAKVQAFMSGAGHGMRHGMRHDKGGFCPEGGPGKGM